MNVYASIEDFEQSLISKLNEGSKIKYQYKLTDKYAVIICKGCRKFAYWYKNTDGVNLIELKQNGYKNVNLI